MTNSGAAVLREAVRVRGRLAGYIVGLARDLDIPTSSLEQWSLGQRDDFAPRVLERIATFIFSNHIRYDSDVDLLRPANKAESRSLGIRPDPIDPKTLPKFTGGPPPSTQTGAQEAAAARMGRVSHATESLPAADRDDLAAHAAAGDREAAKQPA